MCATVPTNLHVTSATTNAVNLAWNASIDDVGVFGYDVYRGTTKVATVQSPQFSDSGLSAGTQYQYKVVGLDGASRTSAASGTLSVSTAAAPTVRDSLNPIGAATYDNSVGVTKSGNNVTNFGANDWIEYANVDFHGGVNSVPHYAGAGDHEHRREHRAAAGFTERSAHRHDGRSAHRVVRYLPDAEDPDQRRQRHA